MAAAKKATVEMVSFALPGGSVVTCPAALAEAMGHKPTPKAKATPAKADK